MAILLQSEIIRHEIGNNLIRKPAADQSIILSGNLTDSQEHIHCFAFQSAHHLVGKINCPTFNRSIVSTCTSDAFSHSRTTARRSLVHKTFRSTLQAVIMQGDHQSCFTFYGKWEVMNTQASYVHEQYRDVPMSSRGECQE